MNPLFFFTTLAGSLLVGAWVSRRRERRAQPIWTWALLFASLWTGALIYAGARGFGGAAWRWALAGALGFFVGFMTCVVAAMTAGRGK
jgi:hypothetical protein